ncbi:hypothetical protein NIPOLPBK_00957 [Stenotrophomonas maltophilia]|nr:hypothetical protein NIPOLPBK_00957 [Stenotrophomonas maltophilia]
MPIGTGRKGRVGTFQILAQSAYADPTIRRACGQEGDSFHDESWPTLDLGRRGGRSDGFGLGRGPRFGLRSLRIRCLRSGLFGAPFEEPVAGIAQCIWGLCFAHNEDRSAAFSQSAAEICKVRVARYQAKDLCTLVEQCLLSIKSKRNVSCVFLRSVLVLKAWGERLTDQRLFPGIAECCLVAIAPAKDHSPGLSCHEKCEVDDCWGYVVAVDHDCNCDFM